MNRVYLDPNTKYSDQYAMLAKMPDIVDELNEVADKAEQVPDPVVADIGKVLGIVSDGASGAEYGAVEQSSGLPAIESGDAGKVLTVNDGETGAEWATPSGGGGSPTEHILFYDDRHDHTYVTPPTDAPTLPTGGVWLENGVSGYYPVHADGTPYTADEVEQINIGDIIKTNQNEAISLNYEGYAIITGKYYALISVENEQYSAICILSFAMANAYGSSVYAFGFEFYGMPGDAS